MSAPLLGLVLAVTMQTQPIEVNQPRLSTHILTNLAFASGDVLSTEYGLAHRPGREANPLLRNRGVRIGVNAGAAVGLAYLSHRLERDGHRGQARFVRWTFRGLKVGVVVFNVVQARRK